MRVEPGDGSEGVPAVDMLGELATSPCLDVRLGDEDRESLRSTHQLNELCVAFGTYRYQNCQL